MKSERIETYVKHGANAAFVEAALIGIVCASVIAFDIESMLDIPEGPILYLIALYPLVCGYFLRKYSRTAALALISFTLLSAMDSILNRRYGVIPDLVFLIFYVRGLRGALAYHKAKRALSARPKGNRILRRMGWSLLALVAAAVAFVLITVLFGTPTFAISGKQLAPRHRAALLASDIISPEETIDLFYTLGLFSMLADGNMITDRRVISYETFEGSLWIEKANYDEIASVGAENRGAFWSNTEIEVTRHDGSSFYLFAPIQHNADTRFIQLIRSRIHPPSDGGPDVEGEIRSIAPDVPHD